MKTQIISLIRGLYLLNLFLGIIILLNNDGKFFKLVGIISLIYGLWGVVSD